MTKRLYKPRAVAVVLDGDGQLARVGHSEVDAVREEWLVEDRWWAGRPVRRHYFELATADGANRVVFRDDRGRWFAQDGV